MKKSVFLIILSFLCATLLISCGCKHEDWKDADCETAKICIECGETEGEALGHKWVDATCETPKTCSICQKTEGSALGHSWADAACEAPKTCQTCGLTEGDPLGHTWVDATTEAPKTCSVCNQTEGERIITDPRFTTAACEPFFGCWSLTIPVTGEMMGLEGFIDTVDASYDINFYIEFTNDGKVTFTTKAADPDAFNAAVKQITIATFYQEYAAMGMSKEEADADILATTGMTMDEYMDSIFSVMDMSALLEVYNMDGYYYVSGSKLYVGTSWDKEMDPSTFRFLGNRLTIVGLTTELGLIDNTFTRVPDDEV